jgi:hypothetical protein
VDPEDEKAGTVPVYPNAKYWIPVFKPLSVVNPVAAVGHQVNPVDDSDEAVKT